MITGSEGVEHWHRVGIARGEGERDKGTKEEDVVRTHPIQALVNPLSNVLLVIHCGDRCVGGLDDFATARFECSRSTGRPAFVVGWSLGFGSNNSARAECNNIVIFTSV